MSADALKSMFKGGIASLYYFHGENTRDIDETLVLLKEQLFADADVDFDCERFDGQLHSPAVVLQAAQTMPFCFERRLVVVQRVDAWSDADLKKCAAYCAKPSSKTCLVFVSTSEKKKLSGWVKKSGKVRSFVNPRWDRDIRNFVVQELARHKKKANAAALELLCQELNGNAQTMAGEIEKLALYCLDRQSINEADVEQALSGGHHNTIFTLVDSIGAGRLVHSLGCLKQLLDDGMAPLQVLAMIARQFRLLARVCEADPKRAGTARIRQALGFKSDFQAQKIIKQAGKWSSACFGTVFEELSSADRQLKSSRKENRLILENLLLRLANLSD
jgi:DNA polymerase-3 subunit delta